MFTYDDALRHSITSHLTAHPRLVHAGEGLRHAAVAVVLVDSTPDDEIDPHEPGHDPMRGVPGNVDGLDGRVHGVSGGAAFLLCRRAARLNRHAGQWALPGGRLDADETPLDAALRELDEELGLTLRSDQLLGYLDDYVTRSGYLMTPVVLWAGENSSIVANPDEVAHTYRIGLHELCRPDSPRFVTIPESDRPVVQVPLGGDLIHAPTGAVLVQLRWVALEGRLGERVSQFEQPVFAWS